MKLSIEGSCFTKGKRKQIILGTYEEPRASCVNEGPALINVRLFTILWIMLYVVETPIYKLI